AAALLLASCVDSRSNSRPPMPYGQARAQVVSTLTGIARSAAPADAKVAVEIADATYNDRSGWIRLTCAVTVSLASATDEDDRARIQEQVSDQGNQALS